MEIISFQYRDITQQFISKVRIKLVALKKEQPNQFLLTAKLAKEKVDSANERLQEFHTTSQSTGLFNDQDYKLNTILSQVKEDISQIHIHLNQLKTQLNNDLHQSIFDFVQQKALKTSDQFKKLVQSHSQRIKQQEEKKNRLNGERDRVIKRVGFNQKYQKLNETEEEVNHQTIQMFEQKQNEEKLISMQKIESMLNDIAGVFQRVGTTVRLQETMIERIDKYTDEASLNVSKGRKELQESHKRISSNRGLILKVFCLFLLLSTLCLFCEHKYIKLSILINLIIQYNYFCFCQSKQCQIKKIWSQQVQIYYLKKKFPNNFIQVKDFGISEIQIDV